MDCYKKFAHIYDKLIHDDVDYKKWARIILNICDDYKINKEDYLDLACGTGNMTIELAKSFKHTWAVDVSDDMLSEAEEKMRKENLKAKFVCQDISNLMLNKDFDLITCVLDSTNYITKEEDLERYFESVYKHLKEKGIFIFDINSYYKLTEILGNNLYSYDDEDVVYIWENALENDIVDMYLTFFIKDGELYRRFDEEHKEKAYKADIIEKILNKSGFEILKKLDNYEDENIKENTERISYVLKKGR